MEGTTPATPDADLAPQDGGTPTVGAPAAPPPAEPAAAPAVEPPADQSAAAASPFTQAEYTQSQQAIAEIRRELGLPRTATRAEVVTAFKERLAAPAVGEPEDEPDPRIVEAEQRARAAERRMAVAIYGEAFTADVIRWVNLARTTDDFEEFMLYAAAFRDTHAPQAATVIPEAPPGPAPVATPPADAGLPEGDVTSARPTASRRRESGATTAIRGLFKQAAEAATGRS